MLRRGVAVLVMALLLGAGAAYAHKAPKPPPTRVSGLEFLKHENAKVVQVTFVSAQASQVQSDMSTCADDQGDVNAMQYDQQRAQNSAKLYVTRGNGETEEVDWAKGLAARAEAYQETDVQDAIGSASNKLGHGWAKLKDALLDYAEAENGLAGFSCNQNADLMNGQRNAKQAETDLDGGFSALRQALVKAGVKFHS